MTYEELEKLAREGRLTVEKRLYREWTRYKKYPSKEKIKYRVFNYLARADFMQEGEFCKIKKEKMKKLIEAGAKIKS